MARRSDKHAFNGHEIYWQICNVLIAFNNRMDHRLASHLVLDFVYDLDRKFAYYCESMDHTQFSLMSAFKAISLAHGTANRKAVSNSKRANLERFMRRMLADRDFLTDSQ